jgi:hypothetical protein
MSKSIVLLESFLNLIFRLLQNKKKPELLENLGFASYEDTQQSGSKGTKTRPQASAIVESTIPMKHGKLFAFSRLLSK